MADRYFKEWGRVGVAEPSLSGEDKITLPQPKRTLADLSILFVIIQTLE